MHYRQQSLPLTINMFILMWFFFLLTTFTHQQCLSLCSYKVYTKRIQGQGVPLKDDLRKLQ